MSCYICNRETWTKVLEAWRRDGSALRTIPTDAEIKEAWYEIVSANIEAWNSRYPEHKVSKKDFEDYLGETPKLKGIRFCEATRLDLYDAIGEYLYQCSEGAECHNRPGYYKCTWVKDNWLRMFMEEYGNA